MLLRVVFCAVFIAAIGVVTTAQARCPLSESNPDEMVDFDRWQGLMPNADAELDRAVRRLLATKVSGSKVHRVLTVDNRSVASWHSCNNSNCRGGVAFLNSNPDRLRVIKLGILPHNERVGNESGKAFRVLHTLVEDTDHDMETELIVHYEIDSPRRATSGIQTYEYMAIYNLPDLSLQLFFRLGQHGGGDLHEFCSWKVIRKDFNCDRRTDLLIEQECGMNICFEEDAPERDCRNQPKEKNWHLYWQKANDTYSGKRGFAKVQEIRNGRPYLVISGNFAVAGKRYLKRAMKLKSKLVDAGFEDTMIFNSREFATLACCYRTIVVGRFSDRVAADKLKKQVKAKGFKAYVRKAY